MTVRITHTLADLDRDMRALPVKAARMQAELVRGTAEKGNRIARNFARSSAGKHGKHYPNAFSAEAVDPFTWVYGPDAGKPQGDMSFEFGSRNQRPHLDLAKSADIVGPGMASDVRKMLDRLFW